MAQHKEERRGNSGAISRLFDAVMRHFGQIRLDIAMASTSARNRFGDSMTIPGSDFPPISSPLRCLDGAVYEFVT